MSKVSDVIEKGEAIPEPDEVVHYRIPGDASPLTLCGLDVWEDSTSITERAGSSNCTACRAAADEDKPEPGRCPSCDSPQPSMHPAVGGGGEVTGLCPDAFHGAAPSVLLDLVRQYGDDRAEAARRVATGGLALDALSRAETLLDRITALVPQQPEAPDFLASINKLTIERDAERHARSEQFAELVKARGEREDALAEIDRMQGTTLGRVVRERDEARAEVEHLNNAVTQEIEARDENAEWADRLANAVAEHLGVDIGEHSNANLPWQSALIALEFTASPQSDPSVLSLPQVPRKNVVLVNAKGVRFVPVGAVSWCAEEGGGRCLGLGELIDLAGPVSVVMREPRTVDALTPDMELDMALLRGVSGRVWRREAVGPGWVTKGEHRCNIGDLFFTDGPLTEVFADEPGGEPR